MNYIAEEHPYTGEGYKNTIWGRLFWWCMKLISPAERFERWLNLKGIIHTCG
jgi:hypothetical protein